MRESTPDPLPVVDATRCRPLGALFDPDVPNHPALDAVLSGHAPGVAVVDDAAAPTQALLRSGYGFAFVGRETEQAFLERAVAQHRRQEPIVLIWSETEEQRLEPPFSPLDVTLRVEYRRRVGPTGSEPLPEGYSLEEMDVDLLSRCLWKGEVTRACGSVERFLQVGKGWCVLHGEEIASEAYAVFRGREVYEIGVVTARAHRGRNLAAHGCRRVIEACEAEGLGTYWSCHRGNLASNRVAGKLGFTDPREYRFLLY